MKLATSHYFRVKHAPKQLKGLFCSPVRRVKPVRQCGLLVWDPPLALRLFTQHFISRPALLSLTILLFVDEPLNGCLTPSTVFPKLSSHYKIVALDFLSVTIFGYRRQQLWIGANRRLLAICKLFKNMIQNLAASLPMLRGFPERYQAG